MKTEDIITHLFCHVDDRMKWVKKQPGSTLYPSELVTIGTLFALKGGRFRRFYRWLKREFSHLFPRLARTLALVAFAGHASVVDGSLSGSRQLLHGGGQLRH
jgi:hypothetical protein